MSEEDTELVVFLVENHLSMSSVAQKQDVHDPAVVDAFAAAPSAGVINLKDEMLDRPHLTRAERLLKRIK